MTDLISAPGATTEESGEPPLAWAPIEPAQKKRRVGLWIGLGAGAVVLGAVAASMILIAPGTTVAGIPVGWMTPGAAAEAISSHLAETEVTLTGAGDGTVLSGADLGATLDATALADEAFASRPMWNLSTWMSDPVPATITLDHDKAAAALRGAVPSSFDDPIDAGVAFDSASGTYTTTPAADGTAIDVDDLTSAIVTAVAAGQTTLEYSGDPADAKPAVSDDDAAAMAENLNTMLGTIGFYVGDQRTVPVAPEVAATWIDVVDENGALKITADEAEIQKTVDTLPGVVDRAPVNAVNVVDSAGTVLREEQKGSNGLKLAGTAGVAAAFAAQLAVGNAAFAMDVTETPFETTALLRKIEVNLSTQHAYLYENGEVVRSWAVSTGLPGTLTPAGNFKVFAHTSMQDMGCYEGAPYCTEDVPWITWFTTNIGFHGTYWHNNFGNRMSHGCVNLPIDQAKFVYDWAPVGVEVAVHY